MLAAGSDRKISYWEVFDGSLVRHVEGSSKGCINWLSINSSGEIFASCGVDQIVKVIGNDTYIHCLLHITNGLIDEILF